MPSKCLYSVLIGPAFAGVLFLLWVPSEIYNKNYWLNCHCLCYYLGVVVLFLVGCLVGFGFSCGLVVWQVSKDSPEIAHLCSTECWPAHRDTISPMAANDLT